MVSFLPFQYSNESFCISPFKFISFLICKISFLACFIAQLSIKQSIKLAVTRKTGNKIQHIPSLDCVPCQQVICKATPSSHWEDPALTNNTIQFLQPSESIFHLYQIQASHLTSQSCIICFSWVLYEAFVSYQSSVICCAKICWKW